MRITCLLLGSFILLAGVARADTIKFVDGRKAQSKVTVTDETLQKVEYRRRGIRQIQSYPADKVLEVIYADPPEDYRVARDNLGIQAFVDAAKFFKLAAGDLKHKKGFMTQCLFQAGEAYRRGGLIKEAIQTFDDLIQSEPQSRYVPQAMLMRGVALARSAKSGRARAAFEKLKADAEAQGYGKRWGYEAELHLAILGEQADLSGTLAEYKRLVGQTEGKYPSVGNQAKLHVGRVLITMGKYDEARQFFQNIIDHRAASTREVVAGAYNGFGSALRNGKANAEDMKKALFAYLRVIVSYTDVVDEQAEALYSAGKCFQQVAGTDSLNRSKVLLHRCINEFPNSKWALEAQKG